MINLVKIAHIGSTQGKAGALKFYPEEHFEESLPKLEFIFLKINGSKVPYKVGKINQSHDPWLLYIDNISGPEQAQQFTNSDVFTESNHVPESKVVTEESMIGFSILSSEGVNFGHVIDVEEHPQQILLLVNWNNNNFRIPLHPDIVDGLNKQEKTIMYSYTNEDLEILFS